MSSEYFGWLAFGLLAWLVIAVVVAFGVAKAIQQRDRQIPGPPDSEVAPGKPTVTDDQGHGPRPPDII